MTGSMYIVFKGLMKEKVYLYEVNVVSDNLTCAVTLGTIIVNLSKNVTYVQGHYKIEELKNELVEKCTKMSRSMLEVIE